MNTPLSRRTVLAAAAASTALLGASVTSAGASLASGGDATGDKEPIFDFTDAAYRAGGVLPTGLVGRRRGTDGASVIDRAPDRRHRNVRATRTLPGYDHSGDEQFFTVLADLGPAAFTANSAGPLCVRIG